jgi:hypothetical protein
MLTVALAAATLGVNEVTHELLSAEGKKKQSAAAVPANPASIHAATSAVRTNAMHLPATPRTCNSATLRRRNLRRALNARQHQWRPLKLFRTVPKLFEV